VKYKEMTGTRTGCFINSQIMRDGRSEIISSLVEKRYLIVRSEEIRRPSKRVTYNRVPATANILDEIRQRVHID